MSIPGIGSSLPNLAAGLAQSAQNAQAAVNQAAVQMGAAQQNPTATTPQSGESGAPANLNAGSQSTQSHFGNGVRNFPAGYAPGGGTQSLPQSGLTNTARMDQAQFSSNFSQAGLGGSGVSQSSSLAKMLQSFSQATVMQPQSGNTSVVRGQIIPPGQAAQLGGLNLASAATTPATGPNPGAANPSLAGASPGGSSSLASSGSPNALLPANQPGNQGGASSASPAALTQAATETTAGATTLRAQAHSAASVPSSTNPASATPGLNHSPGAGSTPALAPQHQGMPTTGTVQSALQNQAALNLDPKGNATVAAPQLRSAPANPDASMVAGIPIPPHTPDPTPKPGQLGMGTNPSDPVVMSQVAAANGWGARIQQTLNLRLGIPGFTPLNLISAIGVLIITLVTLRVFVVGVSETEVVGLIFIVLSGIGLMITPWVMKNSP